MAPASLPGRRDIWPPAWPVHLDSGFLLAANVNWLASTSIWSMTERITPPFDGLEIRLVTRPESAFLPPVRVIASAIRTKQGPVIRASACPMLYECD